MAEVQKGCEEVCKLGDRSFILTLRQVTGEKVDKPKDLQSLYASLPFAPFPAIMGGLVQDPKGLRKPTEAEFLKATLTNECSRCNLKAQVSQYRKFRPGAGFWIGVACAGVAVTLSLKGR